jgi:hypothetical protein
MKKTANSDNRALSPRRNLHKNTNCISIYNNNRRHRGQRTIVEHEQQQQPTATAQKTIVEHEQQQQQSTGTAQRTIVDREEEQQKSTTTAQKTIVDREQKQSTTTALRTEDPLSSTKQGERTEETTTKWHGFSYNHSGTEFMRLEVKKKW